MPRKLAYEPYDIYETPQETIVDETLPPIEDILSPVEEPIVIVDERFGYIAQINEDGTEQGFIIGEDEKTVYNMDGSILTVIENGIFNLDELLALSQQQPVMV